MTVDWSEYDRNTDDLTREEWQRLQRHLRKQDIRCPHCRGPLGVNHRVWFLTSSQTDIVSQVELKFPVIPLPCPDCRTVVMYTPLPPYPPE